MGAKDSKPSFITYEDAVKRVSDSELRRIREAFKRCTGTNGAALSLEAFVHEVLCDGVPYEVAEWLYQACGGTKRGIAFKDLLCGIVVLTKGNIEEKIKFLWILYTNNQPDNGMYIYKREFSRTLHMENSSLPSNINQRSSEILLGLFGTGDRVTFDQFRSWLLIHKEATVLSKWLLSEVNMVQDLETPTFYQSLAGVTHLEERDIIELEKCFWSLRNSAGSGELDRDSVTSLLSPPLPPAAALGAFLAFDENRDGHVDFKELCCGLSAACRGPTTERLKFCFKIFDQDGDGVLNSFELSQMAHILCEVANEHARNQSSRASTPELPRGEENTFNPHTVLENLKEKLVPSKRKMSSEDEEIMQFDEESVEEAVLSLGEFLIWSVERVESLVAPFMSLLFEVCHVALGLRPHCTHHERDIVLGWLRRAGGRGFAVGQFWYLVASEWWAAWAAHCAQPCACRPAHLAHLAPDDALCDDSFTTNSTESMGSLAWVGESASLGSGASSGVSSCVSRGAPGPVDNARLLAPGGGAAGGGAAGARALTGEGGALRRDTPLVQHADFELLPAPLWRALAAWHGALHPLPRQVIRPPNADLELELYPIQLLIYRHVQNTQQRSGSISIGGYSPVGGGAGGRALAYTAAFSRLATLGQVCEFVCGAVGVPRDEARLRLLDGGAADEARSLGALGLAEGARLLLELRRPDRSWPDEAPGAPPQLHTGLHNLGNTCYMNAALQAVWNSSAVREYFTRDLHLYELNTTNPLGTKGALALRYGELCKEVWSCKSRVVAPLRVRWCVSVWARALRAGGQHDAQELLAWLLDALHEDLNRASPSAALPAAPAQPGDEAGAAHAWALHTARNWSIITELFAGLLKSRVRCDHCHKESVKFELYNMLSLPLPMDADIRVTVKVILLDGSVPIKYGVRVPAEGTLVDLKKKLSELCDVPPERMIVAEVCGHVMARVVGDATRAAPGADLAVYETPGPAHALHAHNTNNGGAGSGVAGEVSVGGGHSSSLCMPALFCFKRSRSELMMSQSPPATFLRHADEYRSNTLPKEMRKESACSGSPTPSVRSLPARASRADPAPRLSVPLAPPTYLVAVHRKQVRAESYFVSGDRVRPALFGVPLVVGVGRSGRALHRAVWAQVERLLSAPPARPAHNHAADCDDSLGYGYPFRLRVVGAGGLWCGLCAWTELCRGCLLPDTDDLLLHEDDFDDSSDCCSEECCVQSCTPDSSTPMVDLKLARTDNPNIDRDTDCGKCAGVVRRLDLRRLARGAMLAIDWDPTALHLRYQTTREKAVVEHPSVSEVRREAAAGVELAQCLRAFTAPETLEQRYSCAHCRSHRPATKSLQLWRLPPLLIVHLKRFQYVNNKWIKSQKIVNFPFEEFDPTEFLATVPQETILRHREMRAAAAEERDSDDEAGGAREAPRDRRESIRATRRARLASTSLLTTPVQDDRLLDYHDHKLEDGYDPFDLKYRLYAIVSHTGQMSGGHYVAYARSQSEAGAGAGEWVCYNDSSCRAVAPEAIDRSAAYLLFYERAGLAPHAYMPRVSRAAPARAPPLSDDPDQPNNCVLA